MSNKRTSGLEVFGGIMLAILIALSLSVVFGFIAEFLAPGINIDDYCYFEKDTHFQSVDGDNKVYRRVFVDCPSN